MWKKKTGSEFGVTGIILKTEKLRHLLSTAYRHVKDIEHMQIISIKVTILYHKTTVHDMV